MGSQRYEPSPLLTPERESEMDTILYALKLYWMQWPSFTFEQAVDCYMDGVNSNEPIPDRELIETIKRDPRGIGA